MPSSCLDYISDGLIPPRGIMRVIRDDRGGRVVNNEVTKSWRVSFHWARILFHLTGFREVIFGSI